MELELKNVGKDQIQGAEDTYEIMQKIFFKRPKKVDLLKEHFWTIALNRASKIVLIELISMGSNVRSIARPQEIFRIPLYKAASYLILVHNHPSGGLKPSEADMDVTNRLIQVGDMMDIEVTDHVIVTQNSYYSFADNGLIEKLRWDKKYALTFIREKQVAREIERIKEDAEKHQEKVKQEGIAEGLDKGKVEGAKARNKEIAKKMLDKNMDPKLIQELTGVPPQWLGRLKNEIEEQRK